MYLYHDNMKMILFSITLFFFFVSRSSATIWPIYVHNLPKRSVAVTLSQSKLHTARRLVASSVVLAAVCISPHGCSISFCNTKVKMSNEKNTCGPFTDFAWKGEEIQVQIQFILTIYTVSSQT